MKMKTKTKRIFEITLIGLFVLLLLLAVSYTPVYPQTAVVIKTFGAVNRIKTTPGPMLKVPLIQQFERVDISTRVYNSNASTVLTKDRRPFLAGALIAYNIDDVNKYIYKLGNLGAAENRVEDIVYECLKNVFAKYDFKDIFTSEAGAVANKDTKTGTEGTEDDGIEDTKAKDLVAASEVQLNIVKEINDTVAKAAEEYGIKISSVLLPSLQYPAENKEAVYKTITSERQKVAAEIESDGQRQANEIRANFNKEVALMENDCQLYEKTASAKGTEESRAIYDSIYKTDQAFYSYYRTIKMYEEVAKNKADGITITIPSDSPLGKVLLGY